MLAAWIHSRTSQSALMPDERSARRRAAARGAVAAVALVAVALLRPERGDAGGRAAAALSASSHHHGAIRSDDSTDDVTVNNTRLRIYRHHHTTHHHWYEVGNRSKNSGDDDDTSADDDDVLNFRNHSGELDALNHTYCGMPNAITKNTQSSSNATASFQFYVDYLGAFCQSLEDCHIGCSSCGFAFRAALPRADVNLTFEERRDWRWHEQAGVNDYSCFGLHVVDSTARPQGPVPFDTMVRRFRAPRQPDELRALPRARHRALGRQRRPVPPRVRGGRRAVPRRGVDLRDGRAALLGVGARAAHARRARDRLAPRARPLRRARAPPRPRGRARAAARRRARTRA